MDCFLFLQCASMAASHDPLIFSVFPRSRRPSCNTRVSMGVCGVSTEASLPCSPPRPPLAARVPALDEWNPGHLRVYPPLVLHRACRRPARTSWGGIRAKAAAAPRTGRRTPRRAAPPTCSPGSSPPWPDSWVGSWPGAAPAEAATPAPISSWNSRTGDPSSSACPRMRSSARRTTTPGPSSSWRKPGDYRGPPDTLSK